MALQEQLVPGIWVQHFSTEEFHVMPSWLGFTFRTHTSKALASKLVSDFYDLLV